jgi:hypothetical protein
MTITVVPIIEPEPRPAVPLAKVMNERLSRFAKELQEAHLKDLEQAEPLFDDLVIYIGYTSKYNVRWRVVNDVPREVENQVAEKCAQLGYVKWKTATVNTFNGNF